jgi:hypothetical protein
MTTDAFELTMGGPLQAREPAFDKLLKVTPLFELTEGYDEPDGYAA